MSSPLISVIICTRNRSQALARTLESLRQLEVPAPWRAEFLVVDNGSTDATARIVAAAAGLDPRLKYVAEPRRGQSIARNTGLAFSTGDIVLFTDDDVFPDRRWLRTMAEPLFRGEFDAVVGQIQLGAELAREWLTPFHKHWLAAPEPCPGMPLELVGANMGFHRRVLNLVPGFDPELGPGALGFGDDTLFSWQLEKAGARIGLLREALVVHCPDASRLLRRAWLEAGANRGRTQAYLLHHWFHGTLRAPRLQQLCLTAKLKLRRVLQPPPPLDAEGGIPWEISYVSCIAKCQQYQRERSRAPKYARHGLRPQGDAAAPGNCLAGASVAGGVAPPPPSPHNGLGETALP